MSLPSPHRSVHRLLLAALLLSWHGAAQAHAVLVDRFPLEPMLTAAPTEVRLVFNEVVTPVVARVLNAAGQPVTGFDTVSETDATLHIGLRDTLPHGTYVVTYRVISADSHPVGGSFVFIVGTTESQPDARLTSPSAGTNWPAIVVITRAVFYAALLIATGGALFCVVVDCRPDGLRTDRMVILGAGLTATILT